MRFTDIFIKRPVLSCVISLLILVMGLASMFSMNIRQYPKMQNTTITVRTLYPGASPAVVQSFVTRPIQQSVGSADGIDYLTSSSSLGMSTIVVHIKLNYDPNSALANVNSKVQAILNKLPRAAESPTLIKETGASFPALIIGFTSNNLSPEQITAYIKNVISSNLYSVDGVSKIDVWGAKEYAMRLWLNPEKMAKLGVTPLEVRSAVLRNNYQATAGRIKGKTDFLNIIMDTDLQSVKAFKNLVIKRYKDRLVRMKDIAKVELGAEDYDHLNTLDGKKAVFAAVSTAPGSNPLTVIKNVLRNFPHLKKNFPHGLMAKISYDGTKYIQIAIDEVAKTIIEASIIVVIVIFLFLGSLRTVIIPSVTIPLSLIGVCLLMLSLNFSLNLLTLLAMVLAIGMVVDDAIVVLENIYRHVEEGMEPIPAAIKGAREITGPVIVMTCTLAAVYAPMGFMGGLTGALFKEFAFTLAAAVGISGVIALTFSPMLTSRIVSQKVINAPFVKRVDKLFAKLRNGYSNVLSMTLENRPVIVIATLIIMVSCYVFLLFIPKELAPTEDQGFLPAIGIAPSTANLDYLLESNPALNKILSNFPAIKDYFIINGRPKDSNIMTGLILKDWSKRKKTQMEFTPLLQQKLSSIPGMKIFAYAMPPLPGVAFGAPVRFVLLSTNTYKNLYGFADKLVKAAQKSGHFYYVDSDLKFNSGEVEIKIDRAKAAALGIDMQHIADSLGTLLSGAHINYFRTLGYSYKVIPQVPDSFRRSEESLRRVNITTATGKLVPLSTFVRFERSTSPPELIQFQQLNAATISAIPVMGFTQGQSLEYLRSLSAKVLPKYIAYNYAGASRQYMQEGNALMYAFMLAMIIIYLVLAGQFESFIDPIIILVSVPMSIFGALLPLFFGATTMNIYTEIGLITLIGLISKHGILMVEFANKLQENEGLGIQEAIEKSAAIRLRPILMTTAAMIFGVIPLTLATGAGAESRFAVGIVISSGMFVGTIFTLFVIPTVYSLFGHNRSNKEIATS
ncbi:MAG: multidrug efflux protein [Legionellales bacterium]|nr:MAG: multidrug efflux protein [Legionellales bacterium]